jgi:hypothetical protein
MRISRTARPHSLHSKAYGSDFAERGPRDLRQFSADDATNFLTQTIGSPWEAQSLQIEAIDAPRPMSKCEPAKSPINSRI